MEIIPHNIESELLEKIIKKIYEKYLVSDLIKQLLDKKKIQYGKKLEQKNKKRIKDLLIRKGFSWNDISAVFTELEIT
jgi:SOS response regulatory protein OraA/RecX